MSSRNPNSRTSGSSSPSPGENRENIVPQREEIQADETVPKEEEQSADDVADSASKEEEIPKPENPVEEIPKQENPNEKIPKQENPDENIPKPENPDQKIPEEEDPEEENPDEEIPNPENPDEEMPQEENPEEEIPEQDNPEPENPQQANPHELEGEALFSYLSNIVPDFELGVQQQISEDIKARTRQEVQIANQAENQEQVLDVAPISFHWSDNLQDYGFSSEDSENFDKEIAELDEMYGENFEQADAELDAMYAENLANEPNRESGNRGQENPTTDSIHSIPTFEPNRGIGIAEPVNPTIADIFGEPENPSLDDTFSSTFPFEQSSRAIENRERENPTTAASIPPIEPNRGNANTDPENPTITEMAAAVPRVRRIKIRMRQNPTIDLTFNYRPENPTIDAAFDSRPAINPNRGFTIREPQNLTNNPAPAAVPEQRDKRKAKEEDENENARPTKMCKCFSESCFLFPRSTSEEEDDITTLTFVCVYRRNHGPLPSAESPEHFDALFAFITCQLPEDESICLDSLKEKLTNLLKKYLRLLRMRDMSLNYKALARNYDRDLCRLGTELWGNDNA